MESMQNLHVERSVSCDSEVSVYADAMPDIRAASDIESDECVEEDDDYYQSDSSDHKEETMHHLLHRDLDILTFLYGDNSVQYRRFAALDEIDVDLHIPIRFLDSIFADAWKVNKSEPLIVRLHLSSGSYIESSRIPAIAVFQPLNTKNFGFGCQIQKIIEKYLTQHWAQLYHEYENHCEKLSAQMEVEDMSSKCATSVAKLIDMGFEKTRAENALNIAGGHIIEASNLLLEHPDKCGPDVNLDKSAMGAEDTQLKHSNVTRDLNKSGLVKRQSSHPGGITKEKFWSYFKRTMSHVGSKSPSKSMEDLNLMPLQTKDGCDVQIAPSIADGFLVQLFRYVRQRIPTVNEYCVICDERHIFHSSAMLKPTVCQRELCVFAFQTLGVMANAAEDIATDAEVIDLLIHMTRLACKSSRRELIFDPFPTVVDPCNPSELLFNPKEKNFNAVQKVIDSIPAMDKMIGKSASLKRDMDATNPFMYPFVQWIITSNRSHIVKLSQEKQLPFINTPQQALLISSVTLSLSGRSLSSSHRRSSCRS
ncbi:protein mono-ADP-ribosyltransferase PARP8-like isoform X3 [Dreissena polymorpha]|uniref:protein mono-ADP-ribosyltransferase PARP8-like isoform X3 n=1 Tax=Dreissena polymorpha TaxID=45954 RepID=UPI0022656227|nr:protein mono-ADP-ribosyltransferase PARP8-like isoform X3 [Dreissena polymorpha]